MSALYNQGCKAVFFFVCPVFFAFAVESHHKKQIGQVVRRHEIVSAGVMSDVEMRGARKVLSAAAMTYVAALAVSLAQFLRLIILFGGRRRD